MHYYLKVEKMEERIIAEIEEYYRYGRVKNTDIYGHLNTARYPLDTPSSDKRDGGFPIAGGNELVDYMTQSLQQCHSRTEGKGSIDEIFEDRLDLIRSKIDLILLQLSQRKTIHHDVIYGIQKDTCRAYDLLSAWGTEIYRVDRDRLKIERMKFDLEQQKRRETTDYFKDTSLLNRELREALIQYQEEAQKNSLISGMEV